MERLEQEQQPNLEDVSSVVTGAEYSIHLLIALVEQLFVCGSRPAVVPLAVFYAIGIPSNKVGRMTESLTSSKTRTTVNDALPRSRCLRLFVVRTQLA